MSAPQHKQNSTGRFAYSGLDRSIHEKARLGIMTSLATHRDGLLFTDLKQLCDLTDGNLSRHLDVLQQEGLVEIWKGRSGKRPQTLCRLTSLGLERFSEYLNVLERVIADAAAAQESQRLPRSTGGTAEGWTTA